MGKLDEQLIQLINNEIVGKGGGFEEFCTLASEDGAVWAGCSVKDLSKRNGSGKKKRNTAGAGTGKE